MSPHNDNKGEQSWWILGAWALIAVVCFQAAHTWGVGWLTIPCGYALIELSRQQTWRRTFYTLLAVGLGFYGPQLTFFWGIFGGGAIALWLVLAFWVALFGAVLRQARVQFGEIISLLLAPLLWTGLEYFRSELYFLRFTWLTFGMTQTPAPGTLGTLGVYGFGFLSTAIAAGLNALRSGSALRTSALLAGVVLFSMVLWAPARNRSRDLGPALNVAGVQLEFQTEHNVLRSLDRALAKYPETELLMLSEYSFDGPIPQPVRDWCRAHKRYLVAGGKEPLGTTNYFNTAYVVGPDGEICHRQVKSVPIQFFKDGLPASKRENWNSPWGPLGILICYDLSYTRVVDDFVRQGARALIVPTMDVADWGRHQHELHARVAPLRAVEYGIPIFRVCSSGISQLITGRGQVTASAPFPGEGAMIGGPLVLGSQAAIPWDRFMAKAAVAATILVMASLIVLRFFGQLAAKPAKQNTLAQPMAASATNP